MPNHTRQETVKWKPATLQFYNFAKPIPVRQEYSIERLHRAPPHTQLKEEQTAGH